MYAHTIGQGTVSMFFMSGWGRPDQGYPTFPAHGGVCGNGRRHAAIKNLIKGFTARKT